MMHQTSSPAPVRRVTKEMTPLRGKRPQVKKGARPIASPASSSRSQSSYRSRTSSNSTPRSGSTGQIRPVRGREEPRSYGSNTTPRERPLSRLNASPKPDDSPPATSRPSFVPKLNLSARSSKKTKFGRDNKENSAVSCWDVPIPAVYNGSAGLTTQYIDKKFAKQRPDRNSQDVHQSFDAYEPPPPPEPSFDDFASFYDWAPVPPPDPYEGAAGMTSKQLESQIHQSSPAIEDTDRPMRVTTKSVVKPPVFSGAAGVTSNKIQERLKKEKALFHTEIASQPIRAWDNRPPSPSAAGMSSCMSSGKEAATRDRARSATRGEASPDTSAQSSVSTGGMAAGMSSGQIANAYATRYSIPPPSNRVKALTGQIGPAPAPPGEAAGLTSSTIAQTRQPEPRQKVACSSGMAHAGEGAAGMSSRQVGDHYASRLAIRYE